MMQDVKGKPKENIVKGDDQFDDNLAVSENDPEKNYIIIAGCEYKKFTGKGMKHKVKWSKFTTPDSARETGKIEVTIWANFDKSTYTLSDKIFEKEKTMSKDKFVAGKVTLKKFTSRIRFI